MPLSPLSLLTSAPGIPGGGATLPSISPKSAASASLDSSQSSYDLSVHTGDFIVGGGKGVSPLMIGLFALGGLLIWKFMR